MLNLLDTPAKELPLQEVDPRAKILLFIAYTAAVIAHQPLQVVPAVGLLLPAVLILSLNPDLVLPFFKRLIRIYPMILLVTVFLPFTALSPETDPAFSLGPVKFYTSGVQRFIILNIKMILIYTGSLMLIMTTSFPRLLQGLQTLRLPQSVLAVLTYTFRLLYVIGAELERLHMAFQSRYRRLPPGLYLKTVAGMVQVYFTRIIERSDRNYSAMLSRGFNGQIHSLIDLRWNYRDSILSLLALLYLGWVVYGF